MIETTTRIVNVGNSKAAIIPSALFKDSQFPFKEKEDLIISITSSGLFLKSLR